MVSPDIQAISRDFRKFNMKLIENIAHIEGVVLGILIILFAYGILPNKLIAKGRKVPWFVKAIGFIVLFGSIARLLKLC